MEKFDSELGYWRTRFNAEGGVLQNSWYKELMLAIIRKEEAWLTNKTVMDFGSGPRGSLEWARTAKKRICADVLVEQYIELGIQNHEAVYIKTSEELIPLASGYCDLTFTINSLDHVDDITQMCSELLRVTHDDGYIAGSINLNEKPTPAEPQTISKDLFDHLLGKHLNLEYCVISPKNSGEGGNYKYLFDHYNHNKKLPELHDEPGILWFCGKKN